MAGKVVIVNAFERGDFFISKLSETYSSALKERGIVPEILLVNNMNFSLTPFPEQYSFATLEPDLQKSVAAMKDAGTVAFFTASSKDRPIPVFRQFVTRLFHLKAGKANTDIWGHIDAYNKILRIITVLDPDSWKAFHENKKRSVVPLPKISFGLFGFGRVFTRTFGYLKEDGIVNNYAEKCMKAMRDIAEKD